MPRGIFSSNLFATFNAQFGSAATWQAQILKAAQAWAQQTNINFALVTDSGAQAGTGSYEQGDPSTGDIRIGGYSFGTTALGQAYQPPPINNFSIAGDVQFNTGVTFGINRGNDLYTVALHEFGHALGLDESTVVGAAMYPTYSGVKRGLATDDISGIQSIYGGARVPDLYHQAGVSNSTMATATNVTSLIDPNALTGLVTGVSLNSAGDVNYYTFTVPAQTTGTLQVSVQSQGLSLLAPTETIYAANQATPLATVSGAGQYGTTLTATVSGVVAGETIYVKVTGADASAFATGAYAVALDVGSNPLPSVPLPNTAVVNGGVKHVGGGAIAAATRSADATIVSRSATPENLNAPDGDFFEVASVDTTGQSGPVQMTSESNQPLATNSFSTAQLQAAFIGLLQAKAVEPVTGASVAQLSVVVSQPSIGDATITQTANGHQAAEATVLAFRTGADRDSSQAAVSLDGFQPQRDGESNEPNASPAALPSDNSQPAQQAPIQSVPTFDQRQPPSVGAADSLFSQFDEVGFSAWAEIPAFVGGDGDDGAFLIGASDGGVLASFGGDGAD